LGTTGDWKQNIEFSEWNQYGETSIKRRSYAMAMAVSLRVGAKANHDAYARQFCTHHQALALSSPLQL
jgi:hypothetical protein